MTRQEWLTWRKDGVGSSDAPVIMGVSPWATPLKLYEQKIAETVSEDESNQFVKDMGNELEPRVRSLYSLLEDDSYEVALLVMDGFPFIRASLDGMSQCKKKLIEIKLLGKDDYELTKAGRVPEKYIPQVQHQLMVSCADVCTFLGYPHAEFMADRRAPLRGDLLAKVHVTPDRSYQEKMLAEEMKFWDCVVKRKPPVPSDKDYKTLRVAGLAAKIKKWKGLKAKAELIESQLEELRTEILKAAEAAGHPRLVCSGVRLRQESRIGNVNYKAIPELKGVDLDQYRGKGSVSWKMEIMKEEES